MWTGSVVVEYVEIGQWYCKVCVLVIWFIYTPKICNGVWYIYHMHSSNISSWFGQNCEFLCLTYVWNCDFWLRVRGWLSGLYFSRQSYLVLSYFILSYLNRLYSDMSGNISSLCCCKAKLKKIILIHSKFIKSKLHYRKTVVEALDTITRHCQLVLKRHRGSTVQCISWPTLSWLMPIPRCQIGPRPSVTHMLTRFWP